MAKKSFLVPRGTSDILPDDMIQWNSLEYIARDTLRCYGYREIRTPIFEESELFACSVGQTSDIVQKQMLNLVTQGDLSAADDMKKSSLSLRPEGTASIVRSYIQNGFDRKDRLSKLFYIAPMFRGERPQKGRLRQFHQIGVEAIGPNSASPLLDAEMISLSVDLVKKFGVEDFVLTINTLGTDEDKKTFASTLRGNLQNRISDLCPDCQNRYERNVLRILDCKNKGCKSIVKGLNFWKDYAYLSPDSKKYFEEVKAGLDSLGVVYEHDPWLVRGLDYYTQTVFELSCSKLGSQDAVGAGGRYNGLVEKLGGPKVDAIGFALGMERILLASSDEKKDCAIGLDVFMIALGDLVVSQVFQVLNTLRSNGVSADMCFSSGNMKKQIKQANKLNARFALIIGEEEFNNGVVTVKDMSEGTQEKISLDNLVKLIKKVKA